MGISYRQIRYRQIRVNAKECSRTPDEAMTKPATKPSTSFYLPRPWLLLGVCFGAWSGFVERYLRPRTVRGGELTINEVPHERNPDPRKQTAAEHDETPTNENSKTLNKPARK